VLEHIVHPVFCHSFWKRSHVLYVHQDKHPRHVLPDSCLINNFTFHSFPTRYRADQMSLTDRLYCANSTSNSAIFNSSTLSDDLRHSSWHWLLGASSSLRGIQHGGLSFTAFASVFRSFEKGCHMSELSLS
jgi:hypothetical protein